MSTHVDLLDISQDDALKTLQHAERKSNEQDCWLSTKVASHSTGYVKCKLRGAALRQEFYLHQLAVIASGRKDQLQDARHGGVNECSHLCRNPSCFNPAHIWVEPKEINKQRNFCVRLTCPCGTTMTNCTHEPPCKLWCVTTQIQKKKKRKRNRPIYHPELKQFSSDSGPEVSLSVPPEACFRMGRTIS